MMTLVLLAAMAVVNALQLVLLIRLARRITGVERLNERLSHFAEALSLLTDTTEQGLASVATGLTEVGRKTTTRGTTKSTTKKILTAVKGGQSIHAVAADMGMSESEIRLHLEFAAASATSGGDRGSLRI
jgi:hypothetical protein